MRASLQAHSGDVGPLRWRDLLAEVLFSLVSHRGRTAAAVVAIALGMASATSVSGLLMTASGQISETFSLARSRMLTVSDRGVQETERRSRGIPLDAEQRLAQIDGVEAAGLQWLVEGQALPVRRALLGAESPTVEVRAASPGLADVMEARMETGRFLHAADEAGAYPAAVLGPGAAVNLGITSVNGDVEILIAGRPFHVVGIMGDAVNEPGLLGAILIPTATARAHFGEPLTSKPADVLIRCRPGAAPVVAEQAGVALRPDQPESVSVSAPQKPTKAESRIRSDVRALTVGAAAVLVLMSLVGVATSSVSALVQRRAEFGLRRALGARVVDVVAQVVAENVVVGLLGGLLGTGIGLGIVLAVSAAMRWSPVVDPWLCGGIVLVGVLIGAMSSVQPAIAVVRLDPAEALRS